MLTTEILCLEDGQRTTMYQAEPGTRGHDAMTLLSMVADAPGLHTSGYRFWMYASGVVICGELQ